MVPALLGGGMIGLACAGMLVANGRIAGISGVVGRLWTPRPGEVAWRLAFLAGLLGAGAAIAAAWPQALGEPARSGWPLVGAGLLVGIGTQLGNGCTSGHGVCGIPRGSVRSMVATMVFMAVGMITVAVAS